MRENLARLTHEVKHLRHEMRSDLEQDVARIVEHPCVKRSVQDLREWLMPGDGQVVDAADHATAKVASEFLVDRGKQKVVPNAQFSALYSSDAHELIAILCPVAHRFLDEDIDTRFEQGAGSFKMPVGRQENMNCIKRLRRFGRKHLLKGPVSLRDPELVCQCLRFTQKAIAHRNELHPGDGAETLSVPICNVSSTEERDPATRPHTPCFLILHAL